MSCVDFKQRKIVKENSTLNELSLNRNNFSTRCIYDLMR